MWDRRGFLKLGVVAGLGACATATAAPSEKKPLPTDAELVGNALTWLAKQQQPGGHWHEAGFSFPTILTALGGLALMMEGSCTSQGQYSERISKAVDWFFRTSTNKYGLLGQADHPTEGSRYMFGQGYGMLFLANVYGEEEDTTTRKSLEKLLTQAVEFCRQAQTKHGGWGYTCSADGSGFDESVATVVVLQGLRAARNAGIKVPDKVYNGGVQYLQDSTTKQGGVGYSRDVATNEGHEKVIVTAAALVASFNEKNFETKLAKRWLGYMGKHQSSYLRNFDRLEGFHCFYIAQVFYQLGEERYAELFPDEPKAGMTWSAYRKELFHAAKQEVLPDGNWKGGGLTGPVFTTATLLATLQLEKNCLPFFQPN
jgi:hypothetical protein